MGNVYMCNDVVEDKLQSPQNGSEIKVTKTLYAPLILQHLYLL